MTRKVYRTRIHAKAEVFDYIERLYNPKRRQSTLGYFGPVQYEELTTLALPSVRQPAAAQSGGDGRLKTPRCLGYLQPGPRSVELQAAFDLG